MAAAERALAAGDTQEAARAIEQALAVRADDPRALFLGALIAVRTGNLPRAEELCRRTLERDPGEVEALYLLAELRFDAGAFAEAADCVIRGLQMEFSLPEFDRPIDFWRFAVDGIEEQAPVEYCIRRAREFRVLGAALEASGTLRAHADLVWSRLAAAHPSRWPDEEIPHRLIPLLDLAGFDARSAPEWNRALFERVVLPWLYRALEASRFDLALLLETIVLTRYVRQIETEEHFRQTVTRWIEPMRAAGRRFAASLPPLPVYCTESVPRVAFLVHSLSGLAHVRLLADVLEGHAAAGAFRIRPLVVCVDVAEEPGAKEIERRIVASGAELLKLPGISGSALGTLGIRKLHHELASRNVQALVWVTAIQGMAFAFAARIAPVQIWWAMKYHGVEFEEIDGYLTAGSVVGGTRDIAGRLWRAGPIAAEDWYAPELAEEAARVRSGYSRHSTLYGCFGREEKLNSPAFLEAVAAILKQVPEAGFLWTGRHRHPGIQAALDGAGVADRCHFIGWVNTRLYAQVIDVFLDSFPFPCGYTLYEALAAGKPAVLYASAEAAETGARSMIEPLLADRGVAPDDSAAARAIFTAADGERLYLCARNAEEYVALAVRLARDAQLRTRAGEAYRGFVAKFMSDRRRLGRIYAEHIAAIVKETLDRRSGAASGGARHGGH